MTDLNAPPHTKTHPILIPDPPSARKDSVLGRIMSAVKTAVKRLFRYDEPRDVLDCDSIDHIGFIIHPSALSSEFLLAMDRIRLHLETKVRQAGYLGPLDFTYNDFADVFNNVPRGESRFAVFRALNIWYKAIYIRHLYWENTWRDLYDDKSNLTREQEAAFFANIRNGEDGARWRHCFIQRNKPLVGRLAGRYIAMLNTNGLSHRDDIRHEKYESDKADLLQAGYDELEKAVDRFDLTLGWKFSTHAWKWIRGGFTGWFKEVARAGRIPKRFVAVEEFVPRVAEDYVELAEEIEQGLVRLNDPRMAHIVRLHHGVLNTEKMRLREIGDIYDISPQRVAAIEKAALARLRRDGRLRDFYHDYFNH